jgi:hypothetical protein
VGSNCDFVLVAAPPSMTAQWQDELEAKFGLTFDILVRKRVAELRRTRGFAVNRGRPRTTPTSPTFEKSSAIPVRVPCSSSTKRITRRRRAAPATPSTARSPRRSAIWLAASNTACF